MTEFDCYKYYKEAIKIFLIIINKSLLCYVIESETFLWARHSVGRFVIISLKGGKFHNYASIGAHVIMVSLIGTFLFSLKQFFIQELEPVASYEEGLVSNYPQVSISGFKITWSIYHHTDFDYIVSKEKKYQKDYNDYFLCFFLKL